MKRTMMWTAFGVWGALLGAATPSLAGDALALRNFREYPAALEAVTGVRMSDPEVAASYRRVATLLPITGDPGEMSSPMLLAATELAGVFCAKVVAVEAATTVPLRLLFKRVDFTRGPAQFGDADWRALVGDLSTAFYQRPADDDEALELVAALKLATPRATGPTDTPKVMTIACTMLATSLAFLTH
jgi:hypothetical protein